MNGITQLLKMVHTQMNQHVNQQASRDTWSSPHVTFFPSRHVGVSASSDTSATHRIYSNLFGDKRFVSMPPRLAVRILQDLL
mmetsp:Transcript_36070/g.59747  ORF Transcript_36070/g.59747 Transcript_36070/m.59747 type:complete len:82 (-) Transcript_36070:310-555(-)